jgi:general secretion pathway protein D
VWGALAAGAAPAGPARAGLTLDFPDTEVPALAAVMAELLERPIVVDPRAKGRLSLRTGQPVSRAQALALFAGTLRGAGLAMVESAGLLKIVPEAEAKLQAGAGTPEPVPRGDPVLTQVFRPNHENAANLAGVLRPLISPNNTVNVNAGNNTLVVTDYASNLQRIGQLVAALDTPSAVDVEVIPLQHAVAGDLAPLVTRLLPDSAASGGTSPAPAAGHAVRSAGADVGGAAGTTVVLAHASLNALLVRSPNPARLAMVRALVARLDQPGVGGVAGSQVHVIHLRHVEATRLATVLRAAFSPEALRTLASQGASALLGTGSGGTGSTGATSPTGGKSAFPGATGGGNSGSGSGSSAGTASVSAAESPVTGGYIQADPASNSLVVTAPEPLYLQLRAVVEQLDARRAQLYVESLVVEVDASKALDVGLQWKEIFNISTSSTLTLGTVAQAIESVSGSNILSTANLVTLDNEEARIVVGQNVPFVTGSYTSSTSSNPFQTIERQDVGLTLRIRPQIGPNGAIRMNILQESSTVSSTTTPGTTNAGPTTHKRAIESTVMVQDGKILVLGGLIEDSHASEADRWPLLGGVPVLGALFRTFSQTRKKTNLMVFLRPTVMRDEAAVEALSVDRYEAMRRAQQALPADVQQVLPEDETRTLPLAPPPGRAPG